jgi:osmotically-inducible protein OsmY
MDFCRLTVFAAAIIVCASMPVWAQDSETPDGRQNESSGREESAAGAEKNDALRAKLAHLLEADRNVRSYKLDVVVSNGIAILDGKVDNLLARDRAAQIARAIQGVHDVRNRIEVARPIRPSWEIRNDVRLALSREKTLDFSKISTEVDKGYVILTGTVGSEHRRKLAESLARSVPGVAAVENEINVVSASPRTDEDIKADVLSLIRWDPQLATAHLTVAVSNGIVAVSGNVGNAAAKSHLYQMTRLPGIADVDVAAVKVDPPSGESHQLSPTGR